jgi:hypothetical protein
MSQTKRNSGGIHLTGTQAAIAGILISAALIGAYTRFSSMETAITTLTLTTAKKEAVETALTTLTLTCAKREDLLTLHSEATALQGRVAMQEQMSARDMATLRGEVTGLKEQVSAAAQVATNITSNLTQAALTAPRGEGRR